jgi:hypothetical protein
MKQNEKKAVVKLVRHMQGLQRQITKPSCENATDEEVLKLFELLWEWTPTPRHKLPSKHVIENLVGLMRGCQPRDYCYISRGDVARIIREESKRLDTGLHLSVYLCKDDEKMTDNELYDNGTWNYKPTALVDLLWNMHCNPQMFKER